MVPSDGAYLVQRKIIIGQIFDEHPITSHHFQLAAFKGEAFRESSKFNLSQIHDPVIRRKLKIVGVRPLDIGT